MPNSKPVRIALRLEDIVALIFFIFTLLLQLIFRGIRGEFASPSDVLVIVPAVALLLAKEIVHYFVSGDGSANPGAESVSEFVKPYWTILRDWFPFLVILLMYYSLWGNATHLLVTRDRDAQLLALDLHLFGFEPSVAMQSFISPALTAWMQFAYAFHLYNIPLVACFIYLKRPRSNFREMMCGLSVISFFGILGYLLVPAIGPVYTLRGVYTVPLSQPLEVFNRQIEFMDFARIQRDVFPSLHVGISFVVWLYAYRNSKKLFWLLSPLVLSLWVSTVYLRYHYVVDCIAGLILAPLCFLLANRLFKRFGEVHISLPFLAAGRPAPLPEEAGLARQEEV
jgi:membrane-associated phospholipid phosphatase